MLCQKDTKFQRGDRFYLKNDRTRRGTILRIARDDEFGCDLATWHFDYYVVQMDNGENAPIQTDEGGIAEDSDMVKIVFQ